MAWLPKKCVIVPTDFSDESLAAIDTALQLVASPSDVIVAHVLYDISPADPGEMWHTIDPETRKRHAEQALRERLTGTQASVSVEILCGDAGREVTALADRTRADLLVLSSHGRRGVERLLIGSVAERIVRLAHCPVLVLRP